MTSIRKRENLTDLGNSRRFVEQHAANVRYVPAWRKWLYWEPPRWVKDESGVVTRRACDTADSVWDEVKAADYDEKKDLSAHALRSESEPKIRAMLALAAIHERVVIHSKELDADPYKLAVANGVLDLKTMELEEPKRSDLITKMCNVKYDPAARAPRWEAYLNRVLAGDEELKTYIQRAIGYSLTGDTSAQAIFFLFGVGANGKSVFLHIMRSLFGDYGATADFSTFLVRRSEGPRSDLARLEGARFVGAVEASEGKSFDEGVLKQLAGQDTVTARRLYQDEVEFQPTLHLWLAANHKPTIRETTDAIWRRIHLIPFTVIIPLEERDPDIRDVLRGELPGILNWALEGCRMWRKIGLAEPERVKLATKEYREDSNTLGQFIGECCIVQDGAVAPSMVLYNKYKDWCVERSEKPLTHTAFGRKLGEAGFDSQKQGRGNTKHRLGIRLREASEPPDVDVEAGHGQYGQLEGVSGNSSRESNIIELPYNRPQLSATVRTPEKKGLRI
jgi:putative DNA primase/helicase